MILLKFGWQISGIAIFCFVFTEHAIYEVSKEWDYLAVEPCCLVGPRHKFSCKRLLQEQQRLRSVGRGGSMNQGKVGWGGEGEGERVELRVWSLPERGRFMTPSGILVARLQVRLDGYLPTLPTPTSGAAILEHLSLSLFFSCSCIDSSMLKEWAGLS